MASRFNQATLEQYVINCIIDEPSLSNEVKDYFLSDLPKTIITAIDNLRNQDRSVNIGNIVLEASKFSTEVTKTVLDSIRTHEYDLKEFDNYAKELKSNYTRENIRINDIKDLVVALDSKDNFDINTVHDISKKITDKLNEEVNSKSSKPKGVIEVLEDFEDTLRKRANNTNYISSGCLDLDKALGNGLNPSEIHLIYGRPSMGKSAVKKFLQNGQLNLRQAFTDYNYEMSLDAEMQRLLAMRSGQPYYFFYNSENDEDKLDLQLSILKEQKERLKFSHLARFSDDPTITLETMEANAEAFQRETGIKHFAIWADLASMIPDLKKSEQQTTAISRGIDKISEMAKRLEIAFVGLVQSNRNTIGKNRISKIEQIDSLRPQLEHLKDSGTWEERARVVIGIHRPKYYIEKYLPEYNELTENIIEAQILKNTHGATGKVLKYFFNEKNFKMYPYYDPYEELEKEREEDNV